MQMKLHGAYFPMCLCSMKSSRPVSYTHLDVYKRQMKNHARCFEYMVIIRAINTIDAMTASVEKVDWEVLEKITNRILAEVENVNRVCYDCSPKPPATIEFE